MTETKMKWTSPLPGVWESCDGWWRIERQGHHSGYGGTRVNWRISRWDYENHKWGPSPVKGWFRTLARAKAAVEEAS